jgi:hypothetical protein
MPFSARTRAVLAAICFSFIPIGAGMSAVGGDQEATGTEQPESFWMRKKLEYSQNILAGIATADFDKIVLNAESMRSLSKIEGFVRGRKPGYRTQLHIFEGQRGRRCVSVYTAHDQLRELPQATSRVKVARLARGLLPELHVGEWAKWDAF